MKSDDPIRMTIQWYSQGADVYKKLRSGLERDAKRRSYFLQHIPWKKILDIWCAHWRDVNEFLKKWFEVTWIDLTPEFVSMAKESCPNADIQLMDMRKLKFDDKTFDGIRSCASFLHIPKNESQKTLQWFHRVLKKWWLLFIGVMQWIWEWYDRRNKYNNIKRFFSYRQKDELEKELENSDFLIQKSLINKPSDSNSIWINIFAIAK